MKLLTTGAFVRASRSARLSLRYRASSNNTYYLGIRLASRVARAKLPEEFSIESSRPDQRHDSQATEGQITLEEQDDSKSAFKRALEAQQTLNKVITQSGFSGVKFRNAAFVFDETSNLSPSILDLVGRNLYDIPNHPICITRKLIESVFAQPEFINHVAPKPAVSTRLNFDVLGFPEDHPGRSRTDTYYIDSSSVLRTHTSAHQHAAFKHMKNIEQTGYTICADVYRRDSIDRSHFPVFHQMEGAKLWQLQPHPTEKLTRYQMLKNRRSQMSQDIEKLPKHGLEIIDEAGTFDPKTNPIQAEHDHPEVRMMATHLKRSLELLVNRIFSAAKEAGVGNPNAQDEPLKIRWIEAYFPFTSPSWELEVWWQGEWLELLGCGIVQQPILNEAGLSDRVAWAWGIGVERLAMLLFGIPDIRLFWSTDKRFLDQFHEGKVTKFEPFSKYPACYKDIAFWINAAPAGATPLTAKPDSGLAAAAGGDATKALPSETVPSAFHENDMMEILRDIGGSLIEDVKLLEEFVHPKSGRKSLCYRINYRSLERTLTNEEVNQLHNEVASRMSSELGIELR